MKPLLLLLLDRAGQGTKLKAPTAALTAVVWVIVVVEEELVRS